ncbi:MAG: DegT/DnrJ/EryC1/StrS family aminotransferase [Candidatus Hydrogenedentes bacterium]|nr:DegT/DnrJ/EryC1/StrS family aminotransferase [Candidatus Hydrogenedentota bacterium]
MADGIDIPFADLRIQTGELEGELTNAIQRVLTRGWFVQGEEVSAFERDFAQYLGAAHAVGVASGTDAIQLALMALGVGAGDEVITVANTCVPTVSAIVSAGARPVLVDVCDDTLTLDPAGLAAALTPKTRAIVPVHLYGHPCDMDAIVAFAAEHGLVVVEDCAQAHGARYKGRLCGTLGHAAAFSFYPSKNLGALGDGGAVVTGDAAVAARLRMLRNYGEAERYTHTMHGVNSRLDEIQAAVLRVKLPHLEEWNAHRKILAAIYREELKDLSVRCPFEADWAQSCHHLFPIRCADRDRVQEALRARGVQTLIHYPIPIHLQPAYSCLGYARGRFPVSEAAADAVLSLPLHSELDEENVGEVCRRLRRCLP